MRPVREARELGEVELRWRVVPGPAQRRPEHAHHGRLTGQRATRHTERPQLCPAAPHTDADGERRVSAQVRAQVTATGHTAR